VPTSAHGVDAHLADELLAPERTSTRASTTLFVAEDDPRRPATPAPLDPQCVSASRARGGGAGRPWVEATVESPADCPLTFAMNYAETLQATATTDGKRRPLALPAYGTMAAVRAPRLWHRAGWGALA
jgi:hypothetical protein